MSILQYKYKAHKLVNTLFYVIVFVIGFVLGFGAKEINFSKLLSQVLMVDNVSAEELSIETSDLQYLPDSSNYNDEDFILSVLNEFNKNTNSNYSFEDYPYVLTFKQGSDYVYYFYKSDIVSEDIKYYKITFYDVLELTFGPSIMLYEYHDWTSTYTNAIDSTNSPNIINSPLGSNITNVLDFEGSNLTFNENLFKDNPDFKKVCVDSSKHFAITSTIMSDINSVYDFDYIWFPYNLNGIHKILYDNSVESSEIHYEEIIERYFFNTKENIDSYFDNDIPGLEFEIKGYTDKYSYYGWSAFPFRVYYSESVNQFNIFWFDGPTKIYIGNLGEGGSVHGGGGLRLDFDNEIDNDNNYCFYIKNIYEVTEVNLNEFNDYYGSVPTPNGTLDFTTSFNESNMDSGGLMTQVNKFIIHMKDTFEFIKDFVYEFYLSMPLLFRMFLISVLVILIVGFIIRMVVK